MTTALEGASGQQHAPAALYPPERAGTHCTGDWVSPRAGLDGRKISPHRDSIPGTSSPWSVAIPTELPGPQISSKEENKFGKQSYVITGLDKPLGLQEAGAPRISRHTEYEVGNVVSPMHRTPLSSRRYYCYSFLLEAESTPGP